MLGEFVLPRGGPVWTQALAADLFHIRHADWHPAAQRHWERLTA